jgi:hypothetical protein
VLTSYVSTILLLGLLKKAACAFFLAISPFGFWNHRFMIQYLSGGLVAQNHYDIILSNTPLNMNKGSSGQLVRSKQFKTSDSEHVEGE